MKSPSLRQLIEAIAEVEPLERTLAKFEGLSREEAGRMLESVADVFPAVPASKSKTKSKTKSKSAVKPWVSKLHVWSDGACRGNPGPSSVGVVLRTVSGEDVDTISEPIGRHTNNYAEYEAVRCALERALELGADEVKLHADSELVVKQLRGQYRVKNESLRPLYEAVKTLEKKFPKGVVYEHVRREYNADADALANAALDR